MDSLEYAETTTTTFEWTVRDLKHLFESTKGDTKSKVIKSARFGGGKWQCLFYPNSGSDGGSYISLYLSCEPTLDEKENSINGKWVREGLFKFSFELRNVGRNVLFNSKEATDHSFSSKTANWGWAQFARRDAVFYQATTVRSQDAFVIICTIAASPTPPTRPAAGPMKSVPKDLLDAVGNLLDDPIYSDVEFVLPSRNSKTKPRSIFAARRILRRAEYFQAMFEFGFAEASHDDLTLSVSGTDEDPMRAHTPSDDVLMRHFEDSDNEDDDDTIGCTSPDFDANDSEYHDMGADEVESPTEQKTQHVTINQDEDTDMVNDENLTESSTTLPDGRNVRPKLSHSSTPRSVQQPLERTEFPGPKKTRVVVRDVAYPTYRAVLYYLYTDNIVFAPLSSSFQPTTLTAAPIPYTQLHPGGSQASFLTPGAAGEQSFSFVPGTKEAVTAKNEKKDDGPPAPKTRKEWLTEWAKNNPGRVMPCSAKAVYRLADKLDLKELKARAFQHIVKSLTVNNVAYEVFSSFSATFEDVRKVQVEYFLSHWADIRGSDTMHNVWQQIRCGRHPGFEEVWPVIALNLEFKPRASDGAGGDGKDNAAISGES
ncbi:hypothetical protein M422DRAFT_59802 [Sphaerobolus stellatus SS14]|uniref:MATH domain-containing protein n=1 Tax=Sphaerobolus stellatus (strain SS14) TaxID=990650 RepID=A0A0C9US09_SPHS4|nr:hypothetical protein M422DRAFT_59802 [Sphaerobolus stellatus SS14]